MMLGSVCGLARVLRVPFDFSVRILGASKDPSDTVYLNNMRVRGTLCRMIYGPFVRSFYIQHLSNFMKIWSGDIHEVQCQKYPYLIVHGIMEDVVPWAFGSAERDDFPFPRIRYLCESRRKSPDHSHISPKIRCTLVLSTISYMLNSQKWFESSI